MDQTEDQDQYNQQKTEGNENLENKVQNLTEKFHGMDENLNTLTNLIANRVARARKGKRKYQSGSFDTRGKKKARTYDGRQNLPRPSPSGNHDQATEVSEIISNDTSVTRPYDFSD